jgi:hypothetical protein
MGLKYAYMEGFRPIDLQLRNVRDDEQGWGRARLADLVGEAALV